MEKIIFMLIFYFFSFFLFIYFSSIFYCLHIFWQIFRESKIALDAKNVAIHKYICCNFIFIFIFLYMQGFTL